MYDYYSKRLSAERLKSVYDLATPRVRQYLSAEINFVIQHLSPSGSVLELGCGYGRVIKLIHQNCNFIYGIDNSLDNIAMSKNYLSEIKNANTAVMDALLLGFSDNSFDVVLCIQNGISAFHVDQKQLIAESLRVTRPAGRVLFSSYSEKFWDARLEWFELQSKYGLLGEIDYNVTGNGNIICKDGFTASTVDDQGFRDLVSSFNCNFEIEEVDDSSIFCIITKSS